MKGPGPVQEYAREPDPPVTEMSIDPSGNAQDELLFRDTRLMAIISRLSSVSGKGGGTRVDIEGFVKSSIKKS